MSDENTPTLPDPTGPTDADVEARAALEAAREAME